VGRIDGAEVGTVNGNLDGKLLGKFVGRVDGVEEGNVNGEDEG